MEKENKIEKSSKRKPYIKAEIISELELETRAGSPLSAPEPWDIPGS